MIHCQISVDFPGAQYKTYAKFTGYIGEQNYLGEIHERTLHHRADCLSAFGNCWFCARRNQRDA